MTKNVVLHFRQLISQHMGLNIPDEDETTLLSLLVSRSKTLRFPSTSAYCCFLDLDQHDSDLEWKHLAHHLTIGESYFFRDTGQMNLLEQTIIPELLEKSTSSRSIRIMSAGCATGEEPYSIAMLLSQLSASQLSSDIQIFGVDINEEALRIARIGRYTNWSFRGVAPAIKQQFFQPRGSDWQLNERIRSRVTFHHLNLVKDIFPETSGEIHHMDLILCRNVNIYFNTETIEKILDKFVRTLNIGGFLITGHAELQGIVHPLLSIKSYPDSVIYQRINESATPPLKRKVSLFAPPPKAVPFPAKPVAKLPATDLATPRLPTLAVPAKSSDSTLKIEEHAKKLFRERNYQEVIDITHEMIQGQPRHLASWSLKARAHANLGEHQKAKECCESMIKIDAFHPLAYYLKAHIAMDSGDESSTKALLKKTLYLDHMFIAPHLELADIHEREGNTVKATRMRKAAQELLRALPSNAEVNMVDEYTAGDLLRDIEKLL